MTMSSTTNTTTTYAGVTDGGRVFALERPWQGFGPFLFASHHTDAYPRANEDMGPNASLEGHHLGNDFRNPEGWSMSHRLVDAGARPDDDLLRLSVGLESVEDIIADFDKAFANLP